MAAKPLLPASVPSDSAHISLGLLLILSMMMAMLPWSTDMYLPALPEIAQNFAAQSAQVQHTLTVFLVTFAIGQLFSGALSDRFGRRPLLLTGFGLYTLGSISAMVAADIGWLVLARFVQALGVCCSIVCARAIVRDLYQPEVGPRVFSKVLSVMAIAPLTAPVLGATMQSLGGWRACFAMLATIGFLGLLWIWRSLPESNAHRDSRATDLRQLLRTYLSCLADRQFRAYCFTVSFSYSMVFCFISGSSFVFIKVFGLSSLMYGVMFALVTCGFLGGTYLMRWIARGKTTAQTARIGALFSLCGGMLMLALADSGSYWLVIAPVFVCLLGHGILQPTCMMGAVANFPKQAGSAVALMGFIMHIIAAPIGWWVSHLFDGTARPMAWGIAGCTVMVAVMAWTMIRGLSGPAAIAPTVPAQKV